MQFTFTKLAIVRDPLGGLSAGTQPYCMLIANTIELQFDVLKIYKSVIQWVIENVC